MRALLAVSFLTCLITVTVRAEDAPVPARIILGFEAYKTSGSEAAWKTWDPDYGPLTEQKKQAFVENLKKAEEQFGAYIGNDFIRIVEATGHYRAVHILVRYEKAPLFFTFYCYRPENDWKILSISFMAFPENLPEFGLGKK